MCLSCEQPPVCVSKSREGALYASAVLGYNGACVHQYACSLGSSNCQALSKHVMAGGEIRTGVIMQAKAERAFAERRAMAQDKQFDAVHHAVSAEAWMQEALRVKPDPRTGIVKGLD